MPHAPGRQALGGSFRVMVYHTRQCDRKKCTGRRLIIAGEIEEIDKLARLRHTLLLDPFSRSPLLSGDRALASRLGVGMIDCSWRNAGEEHSDRRFPTTRRLPLLVPVNPVNYGKPGMLTTAEALAAALHILGDREAAARALSRFKWGPHFLHLNADLLATYAAARQAAEIDSVERGTFGSDPNLEMVAAE